MAANKTSQSARLILKVQDESGAAGAARLRQRSIRGLNPAAADADVLTIGRALAGLQTHVLDSVARQDTAALADE